MSTWRNPRSAWDSRLLIGSINPALPIAGAFQKNYQTYLSKGGFWKVYFWGAPLLIFVFISLFGGLMMVIASILIYRRSKQKTVVDEQPSL